MQTEIQSKVMVHEPDENARSVLREFFDENQLLALTADETSFTQILSENTDLGGIFMSVDTNIGGCNGQQWAKYIHKKRPELPVFLRHDSLTDTDEKQDNPWFGYSLENIAALKAHVDERIFTNYYPIQFIQGVKDFTITALNFIFRDMRIDVESPLLVNDHIIFGELFSLIPLESPWCRGTMMLQTTQSEVLDIIRKNKTNIVSSSPDFRDLNDILNELTNLIWGKLKSDFFQTQEFTTDVAALTQVPILVNHEKKYISFGTREPQLCFKYTLTIEDEGVTQDFVIYQKFIFNLSWKPDDFAPVDRSADDMIESGELEFF